MNLIKRPSFTLVALLISGRILGILVPMYSWIVFSALILQVFSQAIHFIRKKKDHAPPPTGFLLFLAVVFIGIYQERMIRENDQYMRNAVENLSGLNSVIVNARVKSGLEKRNNSLRIIIDDVRIVSDGDISPLPSKGIVYFSGNAAQKVAAWDPAPGDLVRIESRVLVPRSLRNPTLFDYRAFLAQRGIYLVFRLHQTGEFEMNLPGDKRSYKNRFLHAIHHVRREWEGNFERTLPPCDASLIKGICLGSSHEMSPEDREIFLNTGLIHLFSVSGLHTCMIALLLFYVLRILGIRFRSVSFLTVAGIWLFAILTGLRIPVIRSAIMITCVLGSHFLPGRKRPIEGLSALCFAAFWVLVFNPRSLFQSDFIFSYLSVFAILIFMPFFREHFFFEPRWARMQSIPLLHGVYRWIWISVFTVLSVQILLLPVHAWFYHRFSFASIIACVFAIPVAYLALVMGIFHSILGMSIPGLSPFTAWILALLIHVLRGLAGFFSGIPFSSIPIHPLPWFGVGIYYGCILGGNWILDRKNWQPDRAVRFSVTFLVLIALLIWFPLWGIPRYDLEVFFLDVGQGDAIYMEFPDGGNMLIDGGENQPRNMGKDVIAPFLENRGRDSIDAIILTHPDADHLGGLPFILDRFFVNHVFEAENSDSSLLYREWEEKIKDWGIERNTVGRGDRIEGFKGADISILHPPDPIPQEWSQNDRSVVVRMKTGEFFFLFTGDASRDAELSMIESGLGLDADVLKVGHHGSRDASNEWFIRAVMPRISVISVGEGNRHGHPHEEVLQRLGKYSEKMYRTDRNGAVTIRIKKDKILVECQNPE